MPKFLKWPRIFGGWVMTEVTSAQGSNYNLGSAGFPRNSGDGRGNGKYSRHQFQRNIGGGRRYGDGTGWSDGYGYNRWDGGMDA